MRINKKTSYDITLDERDIKEAIQCYLYQHKSIRVKTQDINFRHYTGINVVVPVNYMHTIDALVVSENISQI